MALAAGPEPANPTFSSPPATVTVAGGDKKPDGAEPTLPEEVAGLLGRVPATAVARAIVTRSRLTSSIDGLRRRAEHLSAASTLDERQRRVLVAVVALLIVGMAVAPVGTATTLVATAIALYLATLGYRVLLLRRALEAPEVVSVRDLEALDIADEDLPVYTVLVPAYQEPEVVGRLLAALDAIEYPKDRLDVKLLLEEDDAATIAAVRAAAPGRHVETVILPPAAPRTKPKALNYGLSLARGEFVTIYDAEDVPDPLQLRRAVIAFRRSDPSVACLQAKLGYHNADQNLITRWFTIEYAIWFSLLLPGLIRCRAPLPLGGTSNHIRRQVLEELGAWDPHNVTEDADLGVRLHRRGWRVAVLDSVTLEEANSDFVNWVKQRSRWYKGYLQTWLVHMRRPVTLWRELGTAGFVGFNLFFAGTPVLALVNPLFWALTLLWFVAEPPIIAQLLPAWLYYPALVSWLVGNFTVVYSNLVGARATGQPALLVACLLSPLYWVMMSMGAMKATLQLVSTPSFWEKTTHGLDVPAAAVPEPARAGA